MTTKSIFMSCAFALSMAGIALAGSTFTLASPAMVGSLKLKAGDYEVSVKKDQAVFTNEAGKSFTVAVKIEQADKKFSGTMVDAKSKDGVDTINEIDLGGSTTKLIFGQ